MRPRIKPLLSIIWRDEQTLQLGGDPGHAVVLSGIDAPTAGWLRGLDGTREAEAVLREAETDGPGRPRAERLLRLLDEQGLLDDAAADQLAWRRLPTRERTRMAPCLAAAALVHRENRGGAGLLARRQAATVRVLGAGRVGAGIIALLAAAGVGGLEATDPGVAEPADLSPGGLGPQALGRPRGQAALERAVRVNPAVRVGAPEGVGEGGAGAIGVGSAADVVVVCAAGATDPVLAAGLLRTGIPHLAVTIGETRVVLGPLVLPGVSACLRCLDLARGERDRRWGHVAAQLCRPAWRATVACEAVLATGAAARAAAAVLCLLDGGRPDLIDATVELDLPDLAARRRVWRMHPACGCGWSQELAGAEPDHAPAHIEARAATMVR